MSLSEVFLIVLENYETQKANKQNANMIFPVSLSSENISLDV
jgi:hypothetical protein